jgi:hypothetical protein
MNVLTDFFDVRTLVGIGIILFIIIGYQYFNLYRMIMKGKKALSQIHKAFQIILFDKIVPILPNTDLKEIEFLLNFFHIMPNDRDPQGIMDVIERNARLGKRLMIREVKKLLPDLEYTEQLQHSALLSIASELLFLYKFFRHMLKLGWYTFMAPYQAVELRKMFLEWKDAYMGAYDAFERGVMIGDSIGPMIVTELADNYSHKGWRLDESTDVYYCNDYINNVVFARAMEFTTGDLIQFIKNRKCDDILDFNKIITIDAGLKLLGEDTGSIAKAVGIACGGSGAERRFMEHLGIDTIAFVVKMWLTEAYGPMNEVVVDHRGKFHKFKDWIKRMKLQPENIMKNKRMLIKKINEEIDPSERTLVIGIGNAIGVDINE